MLLEVCLISSLTLPDSLSHTFVLVTFFFAVIKNSPSTWCFILESLLTILLAQVSRSSPANLSRYSMISSWSG